MTVKFQDKDTCNKCGGCNKFDGFAWMDSDSEIKTKCLGCGFEDYWQFGFFYSSHYGLDAADEYWWEDGVYHHESKNNETHQLQK